MKSPDAVCKEYAKKRVRIKSSITKGEYVLIEGNAQALEFVGKLFLAQAKFKSDCGFQMSPNGAGGGLFKKGSKIGLYIHRLPCLNKKEH
jgi:hypothetical protein